jgi:nicotinamidase-related amidase
VTASATVLLVIDMQKAFLDPDAPLFCSGGPAIIERLAATVSSAREHGIRIIHVVRRHRAGGEDIDAVRRALFATHDGILVEGTPEVLEVEPLLPLPGDLTVVKKRWSAFMATELDLLLRRLHVDHVVVTGIQTPNCIRATVADALALDYETTVLSDGTASHADEIQASNLHDMAAMGARVMTCAQFTASLETPQPNS